jgi:hypothetical protein
VDFFPNCVMSRESYLPGAECFYRSKRFFGWSGPLWAYDPSVTGAPPYYDFLMSGKFGVLYMWTAGPFPIQLQNTGLGPEPPTVYEEFSYIRGPGSVPSYTTQSWYAATDGSTIPPRYEWWRIDHDPVLPTQWRLVSTSSTYSDYVNQCESFDLELRTIYEWQYLGTTTLRDTLHARATPCTPPFSVSVTGPSTATGGQYLTFTSSVSGSYGYRYEWWLRDQTYGEAYLAGTGPSFSFHAPEENTTIDVVLLVFDGNGRRVRAQRFVDVSYFESGSGPGTRILPDP